MALAKNSTAAEARMLWHLLNDLHVAKVSNDAVLLADTLDELDVLSKLAESERVQQKAAAVVASHQTSDSKTVAIRD